MGGRCTLQCKHYMVVCGHSWLLYNKIRQSSAALLAADNTHVARPLERLGSTAAIHAHARKQHAERTGVVESASVSTTASSAARLRFCPTAGSALALGSAAASALLDSRGQPAGPQLAAATTDAKMRCTMLPTTLSDAVGSAAGAVACCLGTRLQAIGSWSDSRASAGPAGSAAKLRTSAAAAPPRLVRSRV